MSTTTTTTCTTAGARVAVGVSVESRAVVIPASTASTLLLLLLWWLLGRRELARGRTRPAARSRTSVVGVVAVRNQALVFGSYCEIFCENNSHGS